MTSAAKLAVLVGVIAGCMFAGHRLDKWHLVIGIPIGQAMAAASRTGTDDE